MSIIALFVTIIVIGVIVWAIRQYIPMDAPFKQAILIIGIVVCFLLILQAFGLLNFMNTTVPQVVH